MAKHSDAPDMDLKYQAEDDLRTLVRAAQVGKDKKRLAAAMKMAREQIKALKQVKT